MRPADLETLQPADLWEMWAGYRWRWSRDLEVSTLMTAEIANSAGGRKEALQPVDLRAAFPFYEPASAAAGEDDE